MLKIKPQYKGVSVEYMLGQVRLTKKIEELTEADVNTAKKWGLSLNKYFEEPENKELNTQLPTISYEGVEQTKPKRKKK
jgi:hypothetical protein